MKKTRRRAALASSLIAMMMLIPSLARADWDRHDDVHWRHESHPIHEVRPVHYERHYEHGGWHHGYHNGHLGWWFVLAGAWYAANRAAYEAQVEPVVVQQPTPIVITQPTTPPVVFQAPPAPAPVATTNSPYWYYCRSANSYYPYVSGCAEGWQQVAAQPLQ